MKERKIKPLNHNDRVTVKVGYNLYYLLDAIIEQEAKRGREDTSLAQAGEILAHRIFKAGGLKET